MQSLLRWSIEHSDSRSQPPNPQSAKDLDPGIIDMILGKPDSEQMKEDMAVAVDTKRSDDERVQALDHLEMLIESIDNANDLEKLELWEPLHSLLTSDDSTDAIKVQVLWVIGTALQNNPSAQDAYLRLNPLSTIVSCLSPSSSPSSLQIRSKAIYTLSGLLKHNAPAVKELGGADVDGWARLKEALQDPEISVRRKTVFLLNTLLLPASASLPSSSETNVPMHTPSSSSPIFANSHAAHQHDPSRASTSQLTLDAFRTQDILDVVISAITNPVPYGPDGEMTDVDLDFEDKSIRLLHTYLVPCSGQLSQEQKDTLKNWFQEIADRERPDYGLGEKWSLDEAEIKTLVEHVNM